MDRYPISCWTYFPLSEAWPELARDFRDLGFTNPMTPVFSEGDDPAVMRRLLDDFVAEGLQVILYDNRVTAHSLKGADDALIREKFARSLADFGDHPAVMGFYVGDEPDAPDADLFFRVARIQREMAPNLMPFLNLLPWFDWIGPRMGTDAYAPYLDRAATEGNLAQIGYDCYTQMWEGDSGYNVYFNNLREMRDAARRHNIPFCNTLLCTGHYNYACPNRDDIRWQISTTAALGAKALTYFYPVGIGSGDNYREFPINAFKERSASYNALSEENRLFLARHAELLLRLDCEKSEFTKKAYGGLSLFAPDDGLTAVYNAKELNMLVSTFRDADGCRYRAVVNMDREKNIEAKLSFAPGIRVSRLHWGKTWVDCSGNRGAVGARSLDGASVSMWLAPGQMEIFREE
ncbi:MAG: hypothetical protein J6S59_01440 [Clostridia bacterium]|nr:hypothetical protein [Clostridia bacterium]